MQAKVLMQLIKTSVDGNWKHQQLTCNAEMEEMWFTINWN